MNERRDTFENELTEEDLPDPKERDDSAEDQRMDPNVDSQADDDTMREDRYGRNDPQKT